MCDANTEKELERVLPVLYTLMLRARGRRSLHFWRETHMKKTKPNLKEL